MRTTTVLFGMIAGLGIAALTAATAAASEAWWDTDGNGVGDSLFVDRWEDGSPDIVGLDSDEDGWLNGFTLDADNDGYFEITAVDLDENGVINRAGVDTDLDGYWDLYLNDFDENGIEDSTQWEFGGSTMVISAPTNPDGFYTLMTTMAAFTGQATFGTPDSDHDGWNDNLDWHPHDPSRY